LEDSGVDGRTILRWINSPDIMTFNIGCLATKLNNIQNYFLTYYHKIIAYEREKCAYRVLVVKPKEKRPLGRFRSRWEDNTKMDLQEV
jgi:hypothetical protein